MGGGRNNTYGKAQGPSDLPALARESTFDLMTGWFFLDIFMNNPG